MDDPITALGIDENKGRQFERIAAQLMRHYHVYKASRTREAIQLDLGHENGPILLLTPGHVEIRFPCFEWNGPADGNPSTQLWKRLTLEAFGKTGDHFELVDRALAMAVTKCRKCGQMTPWVDMRRGKCDSCRHKGPILVY